ncbi:hypothetical protein DBR42_13695 [Pelomonas sp. HMWF004]|nr:hypothetical protein DBR42_13695 [Pelomonas sp. HMWF004]
MADASAGREPDSPPPGAPGQGHSTASLLRQFKAVWRELPGLVSDRVELLSLELQRAAQSLVEIVVLLVGVAILGITAWLCLWAALVGLMVSLGLPLFAALLVAVGLNLLATMVAVHRVRGLLPRLQLPATRRHLMLSPDPQPEDRPDDRTAAPAAGPPDAP